MNDDRKTNGTGGRSDAMAEFREQIDAIDAELVSLLNRRANLAISVAGIKAERESDKSVYRPEREARILRRVIELNEGPLPDDDVVRIIREVISSCLALERPLTVAFLGPAGTFTQLAARKHFGSSVALSPVSAIDEVFREVESGICNYGVVPVENSIEGVVTHTLDSFMSSPVQICGEIELVVHHHLLSKSGDIRNIDHIYAHQQAIAQCQRWLKEHLPDVKQVPVSSNADAAQRAADDERGGAIAAEVAAELYALPILVSNIENHADNTTRFLVLGENSPGPSGADKTSIMFSTPNRPGSLHEVLSAFARHGINMSRIESRPSHRDKWAYTFFVDIVGHSDEDSIRQALEQLDSIAPNFKLLGSYPSAVL